MSNALVKARKANLYDYEPFYGDDEEAKKAHEEVRIMTETEDQLVQYEN